MPSKYLPPEIRRAGLVDIFPAQRLQWAVAEASRCLMCEDPPCQQGCGAAVDIKRFIRALKGRNLRGAVAAVRDGNFLVASCGRVCPQGELCEKRCSATGLDRPIAIGELQRFVGENAIRERMRPVFPEPTSRSQVAIVGAGPAGLSAAFYLLQLGIVPDIFEPRSQLGGTPRVGIPRFRLPREILDAETSFVSDAGIRVVSEKVTDLEALLDRYRAVFLGCGLGEAKRLGVPGENLEGVIQADELLEQVNLAPQPRPLDGVTVVLGGGNTALDVATTAVRLGSQKVILAYRRSEAEMPAWAEHRQFALEEGIEIRVLLLPVEILGRAGKVVGVRVQQAKLGEPDLSGRRQAVPVDNAFSVIECQQVIPALGNGPSQAWRAAGLSIGPHGIEAHPETMATSRERVFAGGDLVRGGATVVQAVADGRRAARAIERLLMS